MHAFLIIGNDQKQVETEIEKMIISLEVKNKIPFSLKKIDDSKELKRLTKYSFSTKTAIILNNFEEANNETVNSILKNLEEPNNNLVYILTAQSIDKILPTILSRCQIIKTTQNNFQIENEKMVLDFLNSNTNKRFDLIGKIKEREKAIEFVKDLIKYDYKSNNLVNMNSYLLVLKNLNLNGNVSLQLANLLVRMEPATYGK